MPAGNIQLHLHRRCIAIRVLRWVFQVDVGWTGEWRPKALSWHDGAYWINWLWFSVVLLRETPQQYHRAIGQ